MNTYLLDIALIVPWLSACGRLRAYRDAPLPAELAEQAFARDHAGSTPVRW